MKYETKIVLIIDKCLVATHVEVRNLKYIPPDVSVLLRHYPDAVDFIALTEASSNFKVNLVVHGLVDLKLRSPYLEYHPLN
jgi:hypothetical protein